jgi:hypothetical protein
MYNHFINLIFLIENQSAILIKQNFNKFNFILNIFLKKILIKLIKNELILLIYSDIIINLENAYFVKYIKTI